MFAAAAEAKEPYDHALMVAQAEATKIFHGVGKITGVDASAGLVTIDHEAIPGLMDAMEMQYEAKPSSLLDGVQVGEKVEFAVNGKNLTLVAIKKLGAGK